MPTGASLSPQAREMGGTRWNGVDESNKALSDSCEVDGRRRVGTQARATRPVFQDTRGMTQWDRDPPASEALTEPARRIRIAMVNGARVRRLVDGAEVSMSPGAPPSQRAVSSPPHPKSGQGHTRIGTAAQ